MLLPGRDTFDPQYRFGFNGKENELDFRGVGRIVDLGERMYDARIARLIGVDPLTKQYPFFTPYQFAGNTPIQAVDILGMQPGGAANRPVLVRPQLTVIRGGQYDNGTRLFSPSTRWDQNYVFDINGGSIRIPTESEAKLSYRTYPVPKTEQDKLIDLGQRTAYELKTNLANDKATPNAAQAFTFDQAKREATAEAKERERLVRTIRQTPSEVYHLTAKANGWYTCNSCTSVADDNAVYRTNPQTNQKEIYLKQGEIWKIGKHNLNGQNRYTANMYESQNFDYKPTNFIGNETQALIEEKKQIVLYPFHPENRQRANSNNQNIIPRPPGNKQDN